MFTNPTEMQRIGQKYWKTLLASIIPCWSSSKITPAAATSKPKVRLQLKRLESHATVSSSPASRKATRPVLSSRQHNRQAEAYQQQRPESKEILHSGYIHSQRKNIPNVRREHGKQPRIVRSDMSVAELASLKYEAHQNQHSCCDRNCGRFGYRRRHLLIRVCHALISRPKLCRRSWCEIRGKPGS